LTALAPYDVISVDCLWLRPYLCYWSYTTFSCCSWLVTLTFYFLPSKIFSDDFAAAALAIKIFLAVVFFEGAVYSNESISAKAFKTEDYIPMLPAFGPLAMSYW